MQPFANTLVNMDLTGAQISRCIGREDQPQKSVVGTRQCANQVDYLVLHLRKDADVSLAVRKTPRFQRAQFPSSFVSETAREGFVTRQRKDHSHGGSFQVCASCRHVCLL